MICTAIGVNLIVENKRKAKRRTENTKVTFKANSDCGPHYYQRIEFHIEIVYREKRTRFKTDAEKNNYGKRVGHVWRFNILAPASVKQELVS